MSKAPEISKIAIYETEDGQTKLQVKIEGETVWLTQDQMAELFQKARYFQEFLQRIRDIRSSERNFYQKVTDIYATSIDTFGGVQTPPFRAGKEYAALSINPEQTPRFSAGCRRIDYRKDDKLTEEFFATVSKWILMKNKNKIPDSRAMENMTSDLSRLAQGKDFKS